MRNRVNGIVKRAKITFYYNKFNLAKTTRDWRLINDLMGRQGKGSSIE